MEPRANLLFQEAGRIPPDKAGFGKESTHKLGAKPRILVIFVVAMQQNLVASLSRAGGSPQASFSSKLVLISAVLPSMMLAEQYFSWLMAMARSTAAAGKALPVTVKCM